jgi:hypothetical protein
MMTKKLLDELLKYNRLESMGATLSKKQNIRYMKLYKIFTNLKEINFMNECEVCKKEFESKFNNVCDDCRTRIEEEYCISPDIINQEEIIKELLNKLWDVASDGYELSEKEIEKYLYLADNYESHFGCY